MPTPAPITLAQTLGQTLPQGGTVPLAVALVAGIILWLFGAKLVKPVFLLLGLAAGGFVGAILLPMTGIPPFDLASITLSPGVTGVLIGGVIGALVALALFRVVITMTAALAFAAAGLMGALVFLHFNPAAPPETPPDQTAAQSDSQSDTQPDGSAPDPLDSIDRDAAERTVDAFNASRDAPLLDDETKQDLLDAAERSRAFLRTAADAIGDELETRTMREKTIAFASMFGGLALGLLVGVTMPNRTAALVTALLGAAIWMSAALALMTARTGEIPDALDRSAIVWGSAWIIVTLLGLLVQLGFLSRAKPARDTDDPEE